MVFWIRVKTESLEDPSRHLQANIFIENGDIVNATKLSSNSAFYASEGDTYITVSAGILDVIPN